MENLGVDPKLLVAQIINFALFFFIFSRFIAKPFLAYLAGEKKKDADRERMNEVILKQEEEMKKRQDELKLQVKREMDAALMQVKKEAQSIKADLLKDAEREAGEIVSKAHKEMTDEKNSMERQLKEQVATLSTLLVREGLRDFLNDDMKKAVTAHIVHSLQSKKIN